MVPSILQPEGVSNGGIEACVVAVKKFRSGEDENCDRVLAVSMCNQSRYSPLIGGSPVPSKPFAYELLLLDLISHKNVVKLVGFVEDIGEGVAWTVFKWEANGNMREFIGNTKLELPERISLVRVLIR